MSLVKRLVHTSQGPIELDLGSFAFFGSHVDVTIFHREDGWASAQQTWNAKWRTENEASSLEDFLSEFAAIPIDEAAQIAEESIREWLNRGGELDDRKLRRMAFVYLGTTFGLAALGGLTLLGLLVILALRLT